MDTKKILLSTWIACIVGFSLLTGLVIKDRLRSVDFAATVKLQDKIPKRFDDNLVHAIDLGSMEVQTTIIVIALFLAPISKKIKLALAVAYVAGLVVTLLGKNFLPQPAPPFLLQRGAMGFSFPSSHVQVDASYPSGHTYRVVFLASLLSGTYLVSEKRSKIHLGLALKSITFSVVVMIGLVLLGKHWASDIGGGIFLAAGLVSGALHFFHKSHNA
jgi:membrane-associated phospholipid phosphatase